VEWVEISVTINPLGVEAVANMFHEMGAGGVVIEEPQWSWDLEGEDILQCQVFPGVEEVGTGVIVRGYLPADDYLAGRLHEIRRGVDNVLAVLPGAEGRVEFRQVKDEDWAGTWKKYYRTLQVGKNIVIKPAWEDYIPTSQQVVIELDPGMAFGTGTHPTTVMCLQAIEEIIVGGERVFDVGTGSGILAIAAAKLGAKEVIAIDNDSIAVRSARANVQANGMQEKVIISRGDLLTEVAGKADLIVANLTVDIIKKLAVQLGEHLNTGAKVVLGGIIAPRVQEVHAMLAGIGLIITGIKTEGDWVTVSALKEG
jgi:ribosomal protein L11 methyltransferase